MPKCRNCGTRLSKLDNDICPVCGIDSPLEGVVSETIEITSQYNISNPDNISYQPRSRLLAALLGVLCGFTGATLFYLKYVKFAVLWLICHLMFIAALFLLLFFVAHLSLLLSILIPVISIYAFNIAIAIYILCKKNIKDNNGEFIR